MVLSFNLDKVWKFHLKKGLLKKSMYPEVSSNVGKLNRGNLILWILVNFHMINKFARKRNYNII